MSAYPGPSNTWVPSWEATGQVIAFARNPKKFKVNDYVAFRPAKKMVGLYLELDSDQFARVVTSDEFTWADGAERPSGNNNLIPFDFREYRCKRYDFPVTLGNLTVEQADWNVMAFHSAMVMQQAMTAFTKRVVDVIDSATEFSGQTDTATNLGGGKWDVATTALPYIRKTVDAVIEAILKGTGAMVTADELRMVIGPTGARRMAESQELLDYLKQSPYAMAQVRGEDPGARNNHYGLPNKMYGVEIVIEDAVRVSTRKGASSTTKDFIKDSDKVTFLSKQDALPGDQVGDAPTPNFSTVQAFYYGEQGDTNDKSGYLVVETWDDVRNKRKEVHVVQNIAEKLVAKKSGYLVTDILT